jgi:hypothetical protein
MLANLINKQKKEKDPGIKGRELAWRNQLCVKCQNVFESFFGRLGNSAKDFNFGSEAMELWETHLCSVSQRQMG